MPHASGNPAVSSGDSGETGAVRSALLTLRRISGLPVAFGGPVSAGSRLRIVEMTGAATNSLRGLTVMAGNGLGGKALALARPLAVTDYTEARTISHEYDAAVAPEGLRSIVAVPVVVGGTVRAVLYGALRQPVPVGDRVVSATVAAARQLAQALAERDGAQRLLTRLGGAEDDDGSAIPAWEEVRQVHSELRALAQEIADPEMRARLQDACTRLAGASAARRGPLHGPPRAVLAPREIDVLAHVATGCTNAEAADRLGLRPETVKSYLRSAMRKLGTRTRLETVVSARRAGLLP